MGKAGGNGGHLADSLDLHRPREESQGFVLLVLAFVQRSLDDQVGGLVLDVKVDCQRVLERLIGLRQLLPC